MNLLRKVKYDCFPSFVFLLHQQEASITSPAQCLIYKMQPSTSFFTTNSYLGWMLAVSALPQPTAPHNQLLSTPSELELADVCAEKYQMQWSTPK